MCLITIIALLAICICKTRARQNARDEGVNQGQNRPPLYERLRDILNVFRDDGDPNRMD